MMNSVRSGKIDRITFRIGVFAKMEHHKKIIPGNTTQIITDDTT